MHVPALSPEQPALYLPLPQLLAHVVHVPAELPPQPERYLPLPQSLGHAEQLDVLVVVL